MKPYPVIITCEHAGNVIPAAFENLFYKAKETLSTHRGWDIGALSIAQYIAKELQAPLFYEETSRLLIEMNRSLDHSALFSEYTSTLDKTTRLQLIEDLYLPYRSRVISAIKALTEQNQIALHLSIHTFTPILGQEVRKTDIGLLFDPERTAELNFSEKLRNFLKENLHRMQIDFNSPYLGTDDGFTTFLRKEFPAKQYIGIEVEVNQKYIGTEELTEVNKFLSWGIRNFFMENELWIQNI